jgi:hypothetical protein
MNLEDVEKTGFAELQVQSLQPGAHLLRPATILSESRSVWTILEMKMGPPPGQDKRIWGNRSGRPGAGGGGDPLSRPAGILAQDSGDHNQVFALISRQVFPLEGAPVARNPSFWCVE